MKILKDWMLVICMVIGASAYLIYHDIPVLHQFGSAAEAAIKIIQPTLLFIMLFIAFSRIEPHQMRPHRWHGYLLMIQGGLFIITALLLHFFPDNSLRMALLSFMLCMICPTATACAVVTSKLGGDMAGVVTYTVLINLVVSVLVPLFIPLVNPVDGVNFGTAFVLILAKIFPLLILPCLLAWLVRYLLPHVHAFVVSHTEWAFYFWCVGLTLAILMSVRAIVHYENSLSALLQIGAASLVACAFQFWTGKIIGAKYGCRISAGQSLGQKNTVFEMWMGYTFLDPIISVAGGFYSIWHNCYNSWQLYRKRTGKS